MQPEPDNPLATEPPREALARHAAVLLAYLALALVVTWPLAGDLRGQVVQRYEAPVDAGQGIWNLWWARESLLRGWNPLISDYIYFPQRINLFYQTLSLPNAILALPALLVLGPAAAFNSVVLLSFALGGYLAYRVARGLADPLPAFAGGFVFAFSAYHLQLTLVGAMEVIAIHWIPLYILVLLRALRRPTFLRWLAAAAALTLTTLASSYYGLFLAVYTAAHVLLAAFQDDDAPASGALRPAPAIGGLALIYAVWAGALLLYTGAPSSIEATLLGDWRERQVFQAAALVDYLAPNTLHPLWGAWSSQRLTALSPAGAETGAALGYSVYLLVAIALTLRWRAAWPWALLALLALLMSLGPELKVTTQPTSVPMPYALLNLLSPFRNSTRPNYWIGVLMLPVGVLVAIGVQTLSTSFRKKVLSEGLRPSAPPRSLAPRPLAIIAVALLIFELWPGRLPLLALRAAPAYTALADDPVPGAVLDLPPRTNDSRAMLAQLCHGRPLAGGYLARTPDYPPINGASAMQRLWLAEAPGPDIFAHDPAGELATLGIRFVVLNTDQMSGARAERLRALLDAPGIARAGEGQPEIYAVDPSAARPAVRPGAGWYLPESDGARAWRWTGGEAELFLTTRAPAAVTLQLRATAYGSDRPLALALDGAPLQQITIPAAPASRTVDLHLTLPAGTHRLTLSSGAERAADGRSLGISVGPVQIQGRYLPPQPGQQVALIPQTLGPAPAAPCP